MFTFKTGKKNILKYVAILFSLGVFYVRINASYETMSEQNQNKNLRKKNECHIFMKDKWLLIPMRDGN